MAINEIPLPHVNETAQQRDKEILRSMVGHSQTGGTFATDATAGPGGDGLLPSGTVVARNASDEYVEYDTTAVDPAPEGTAVGVLRSAVNVAAGPVLGNVVLGGDLKHDQLVGLDAAAVTDLNGRVDTTLNAFIF